MKTRTRLFLAVATLMISGASIFAARNNILLVIADDYGTDSNSLYNTNSSASLPPTPNINSLYDAGVLFRNAYAYPTCSPSRSCLLTGRYGFRTGVGYTLNAEDAVPVALPANEPTIPKVLSASPQLGYRHASFGKWHLGFKPTDPQTLGGWDHFSGSLPCCLFNPDSFYRWQKTVNGVTTTSTNYATTQNVNDAISWLQQQGTNNWFLWLAFNAPHQTFHKPPNELHSYDHLSPGSATQNPRPYHEAAIEALDTEFGRLLSHIDRANTVVIFVGDNGSPEQVIQPPYSSTHAKFSLYEGGIRVPMIVAGPIVNNPRRESTNLVHVVDLFATILEIAGVDSGAALPANMPSDSRSLLPVLTGTPGPSRDWVLSEQFGSGSSAVDGRAIRDDTFKFIRWRTGTERFYDLLADPYEQTNLLTRTLSAEQDAHYAALKATLNQLQNVPQVMDATLTSNRFSVSVDYVQGVTFSLYRSSAPNSNAWQRIPALTLRTNFTVRITDPNPTNSANYYRVGAPLR